MKPWLKWTILGAVILAAVVVTMIWTGDEIIEPESTTAKGVPLASPKSEIESLPRMLELGSVG